MKKAMVRKRPKTRAPMLRHVVVGAWPWALVTSPSISWSFPRAGECHEAQQQGFTEQGPDNAVGHWGVASLQALVTVGVMGTEVGDAPGTATSCSS